MQGIFLALPLCCAAGVAADVWSHGLQSVLLQIGIAIFALFATLRMGSLAVSGVDDLLMSTAPRRKAAIFRLKALQGRFSAASLAAAPSLSRA